VKILFYNHTGKVSGAERVLLMILNGLDCARCESVVLCPADGPLTSMITESSARTISIDPLLARFTWRPALLARYLSSFVRMMRAARAAVIAESPDLVHANSIRAGLVMTIATAWLRVPVIWHVHDLLPRHPLSSAIRFVAFAFGRTRIVAVSDAVKERFRGSLLRWFESRVNITVVHNAVEIETFYPDCLLRSKTRRSLGLSESEIIIGTVGQLTPRKGQLELIEAFAELVPAFDNIKLVIVGAAVFNRDYEYAETLRGAVKRLGISDRVVFLGQREDVPAMTRAFDISVVNSRAEPFGLTVVEAMASGTPVLATAVDGIPEIVTHGQDGWLVDSSDRTALVEGLRKLIAAPELRDQLSARALATVRSRFAALRFIADIQNSYRHTLSSQPLQLGQGQRLQVKLSAD